MDNEDATLQKNDAEISVNVNSDETQSPVVKAPISEAQHRSNQYRALFRKTLSYQKRQTLVNVCCVAICPFMMVLIAGVLANVVQNLIRSQFEDENIVVTLNYCSNEALPSSGNPELIPLEDMKDSTQKGKTIEANYYQLLSGNGRFSSFSCASVIDDTAAQTSPYFTRSNLEHRDTSFFPNPVGGWFAPQYGFPSPPSNISLYTSLLSEQKYPWFYLFTSDEVAGIIGSKERGEYVNATLPTPGDEANKSGFLGNVPTRYLKFNETLYAPADFFEKVTSGDPDKFMYYALLSATKGLEDVFLNQEDENITSSAEYLDLQKLENLKDKYPAFGAIYVNKLEIDDAKIEATLQAGRISRIEIAELPNFLQRENAVQPSVGLRLITSLSRLSNALLGSSSDPQASKIQISHALLGMPQSIKWDLASTPIDFSVLLGQYTFPYAVAFLLPIFVLILVKEKEDRIMIMMRMHGLSTFTYYLTHYLHFFTLQIISSIIFVISGAIFQLKFFIGTDPGVYLILLFLWANTMVVLSFVLSLFFKKSRFALIMTFVIVILSANVSSLSNIIFQYEVPPNAWFIWPLFAFYEGLNQIGTAAGSSYRLPYQMSDLQGNDPVLTIILYLLVEFFLLIAFLTYFSMVIPSEFGVPKPWYFIFTEPYEYARKYFGNSKKETKSLESEIDEEKIDEILYKSDKLDELEDEDAKAEREKVKNINKNQAANEYPVVVKNIRKVYGNGKVANKSMCLSVEKNIVFGLLGPNGAGKSTLIQMMTGLYPPTSGTALVAGYDIRSEMSSVYLNIGVCPQHDILWEDLTCEEHILFYSRLRGVPPEREDEVVTKALEDVNLSQYRHRLSKRLSGGEKRRLSIAISIGGDAPVVFLDEPTTGLDPEVRRTIWNIINNAKHGKTIILTTHSMEEADILSSRIGIMAKGVLRVVGSPLHLKRKYGSGFKLTLSFTKDNDRKALEEKLGEDKLMSREAATKYVEEKILPSENWSKINQSGVYGNAMYEFNDVGEGTISRVLEEMEKMKDVLGVEDWGISQTSLEEVFLNIVKDEDAEGDSK